MKVPEWKLLYPTLSSANEKQKEFYLKLANALDQDIKSEIEGNVTYIFVYLYETIEEFVSTKKIKPLIYKFERVLNFYGKIEKISLYVTSWLKDAYLFVKDFENAWKFLKKGRFASIQDIIYIRGNCRDTTIGGNEILQIFGSKSGLTKFGKENIEHVEYLISIFLEDFYFEKKMNYAEYFLKKFDYGNLTDKDFLELKEYYTDEGDYKKLYAEYVKAQKSKFPFPKKYNHHLFSGVPFYTPSMKREIIPNIILFALHRRLIEIVRESENTVRSERNLPNIGEGWISETELFYKIHNHFSNERVIHHGRPKWLKRQHLDIYFPQKNIGIEYQGSQHQNPIDFFGGEKTFKYQQRLDEKKQKLCKENGCALIYVYENYNYNDVISQISYILDCRTCRK